MTTSEDEIKTPPVAPYMWAEGVPVRERTSKSGIVWRVVSQNGGLVRITRSTPTGRITANVDWSSIVQVKEVGNGE